MESKDTNRWQKRSKKKEKICWQEKLDTDQIWKGNINRKPIILPLDLPFLPLDYRTLTLILAHNS